MRLILAALALLMAGPLHAGVGPVKATGQIEVLFTPGDRVEARLEALIGQARHSVHVQAYVFTRKPIAKALVAAQARGVKVWVLADAKLNQRGKNALPELLSARVPVALETTYAAAHNKLILIDAESASPVVVTGSYNFTWSAQNRNAENVLILHGQREVAKAYLANWNRHWAAATRIERLPVRLVD